MLSVFENVAKYSGVTILFNENVLTAKQTIVVLLFDETFGGKVLLFAKFDFSLERLTNTLRHSNLVWSLLANFVLSRSSSLIQTEL